MTSVKNPISRFCVTVWSEHFENSEVLCKLFHKYCKRWVFQLEKCPSTGKLHYQCRISLKAKARTLSFLKGKAQWQPESKEGSKTSAGDFYCMKEESRVEGPWMDTTYRKFVPRRFRSVEFRPWQQELYTKLMNVLAEYDDRTIFYCLDAVGNHGKSFFAGAVEFKSPTISVPVTMDTPDKMIQCVHAQTHPGWHGIVVFDIPRAVSPKHFYNIAQAIEQIKCGKVYDWRNKYRSHWIETPAVVVFCNRDMPRSSLSKDRWKEFDVTTPPSG